MHASTYFLSPEGPLGLMGGLLMAAFIAIGLAVPYWMLKLLVKKRAFRSSGRKRVTFTGLT